jgi:hypothetical protein
MKIADLFVDLGVTGSEKSIGAIAGMRKGMDNLSSTSLEAKAAILGAMYALQRMFATSGQTGTQLNQFTQLVDTSADTLQRYQWAAQQVGVANQEVAGTFLSIQDAMNKILLNEGAPRLIEQVRQLTEDFGEFNILDYQKTPEKLIQRLQAYVQRESNTGIAREAAKGFGINDAMFAAMRQNAFRPDVLKRAPVYNDREIQSLHKADTAWKNLGTTIEMAFGRFNAKHGEQIVADIEKIVTSVKKLAESFVGFSEKIGLFEKLSKVFEGWKMIFDLISVTIKDIEKMSKPEEVADYFMPDAAKAVGTGPTTHSENMLLGLFKALMFTEKLARPEPTDREWKENPELARQRQGLWNYIHKSQNPDSLINLFLGDLLKSRMPAVPSSANSTTNNNTTITVPQTININGNGTDPKAAADAQKQAAKGVFMTSPARGAGN